MWDEGDGRDSVESRLDTDRQECRRGWQTERGSQGQVWRCLWGQHTWADVAGEWRLREAAVREWGDSSLPFPPCLPVAIADLSFSCWSLSLQGLSPCPLSLLGTLTFFPLYCIHLTTAKYPQGPHYICVYKLLDCPHSLALNILSFPSPFCSLLFQPPFSARLSPPAVTVCLAFTLSPQFVGTWFLQPVPCGWCPCHGHRWPSLLI